MFTVAFFQSRLFKEIVALLVVGALCYFKGVYSTTIKYEAEKKAWQDKVEIVQSLLDEEVTKKAQVHTAYVDKIQKVTEYLYRDPIIHNVYVPFESDAKCSINRGFVELHNKAANGASLEELKNADTKLNQEPSKVKLSDVAETVTINYYEYNKMKSQLTTLQEIVKDFMSKQEALNK